MPTPSTTTTGVTEPALRLSEVLEEEYTHIYGPDTGVKSNDNKLTGRFTLLQLDTFVAKVKAERDEGQLRAAHESAARADISLQREISRLTTVDSGRQRQSENPYKHLAEWIDPDKPLDQASDKPVTEASIKSALEGQVRNPNLLTDKSWLLDAAIRPYTRGLVKRYLEEKADHTDGRVVDTTELTQLLLEDAFADHVKPQENSDLSAIFKKMLASHQAALCLSGGGIRSATFGLGIVQGLAQHDLLGRFKYLSTVSGGGYLGGWLSAWSHQEGFDKVIAKLKPSGDTPIATEADPIHHLRQYSNYLSPQLGLFSADTWTLIATYLRNLLLIWCVILPFLAALAAAPLAVVGLAAYKIDYSTHGMFWVIGLLLLLAAGLTVQAVRYVHAYIPAALNQPSAEKDSTQRLPHAARDQAAFIKNCLVPFALAVFILMLVWQWFGPLDPNLPHWAATIHRSLSLAQPHELSPWSRGGWLVMGGAAVVHLVGWVLARPTPKSGWLQLAMATAIALVGGGAGFLLLKTASLMPTDDMEVFICLSFPSFLLAVLLAGYFFDGVISHFVPDARREWTARYSAWLLIAGVGWLLLTSTVLLGSRLFVQLGEMQLAGGVGLGSGLLTALLGGSTKTAGGGEGAGSRHGKGNVSGIVGFLAGFSLPIAATVTLFCLLVLLSRFDLLLIGSLTTAIRHHVPSIFWSDLLSALAPLVVLGLLAGAGYWLATFIDTNQFSLHAMYRARLIRAYLGASRPQSARKPDPFTGFDENDDLPMSELGRQPDTTPPGGKALKPPFHLINMALNLVGGQNLAWQERKAESFSVSPLHAGAMNLGYRRTRPLNEIPAQAISADKPAACYGGGDKGISLGTAMTISGAAASPNMGYHSSPIIAFLMTLFNVRLGWWLGNPGPAGDKTFNKDQPTLAVGPIWDELTGKTDDVNEYVYLSDGGHFENLGLYEMVLRRNRFIVVSDAGCDEKCSLEDLGNAIRKIRIDLGIPIDFPSGFNIHARSHKLPVGDGQYWALGRIHYSAVDELAGTNEGSADTEENKTDTEEKRANTTDGLLLYVKPGIYGNEPRDVFNYAATNSAFPHESTSDQFFTESQFESYRVLGRYVLETIMTTCQEKAGIPLADFFDPNGPQRHWDFIKKKQAEEKKQAEKK